VFFNELKHKTGYWHKNKNIHCDGICIRRSTIGQNGENQQSLVEKLCTYNFNHNGLNSDNFIYSVLCKVR
jgi:hypothetical protein